MNRISRHRLNAILFTIILHLFLVIVALLFSINTKYQHFEQVILIEPEMLDDIDDNELDEQTNDSEKIDIDEYLANLKNAGTNYSGDISDLSEHSNLSKEELQQMYEEEILREKHGDDYEKIINTKPEDYLPDNFNQNNYNDRNIDNSQQVTHTGPALVYAELEDDNRKTRYLHVPVFTCQGSGIVVIGVSINQDGTVRSTNLIQSNVNNDKDCLISAATDAAKKSKFAIINKNETQNGKIFYQFLSQ
ncbi:MAG TPA: hypothetical protein PLO05_06120 [Bacteroidales bacterium]|nr:hypothetical protein [Bacteroidales bacterium]